MKEKTRPLLLRGGRLFDPASGVDLIGDLLLQEGRVAALGARVEVDAARGAEVFDATGLLVTPGWVDVHTHLREPGQTYKEDLATGTAAAAAGGFTSVACMANTVPPTDSAERVRWIVQRAAETAHVRVHVIGAVTVGLAGETIAPLEALREAGVVAFSDDGKSIENPELLRTAMRRAKALDVPILGHCEDCASKGAGVMNLGLTSFWLGLHGTPSHSEDMRVERDLALAVETGCRYHVAHVSTAGSARLLRAAKARGAPVTGEATPHHLHLTEATVAERGALGKVAPPLRSADDVRALREAVGDGTIDVLATDHAPHASWEKELATVARADFGMVGLEIAFPLYYRLVEEKAASLATIIRAMTDRPAQLLGIEGGRLAVGAVADITVATLDERWIIDRTRFRSKSRNTPFEGVPVKGRAVLTVVGGRVVFRAEPEAQRQREREGRAGKDSGRIA